VLCHLFPPGRPRMSFLFIVWQFSHSLPFHGRSPFRSWPLVVIFIANCLSWFSIFILFTRDLNPFWFSPMLGTHKSALGNPLPALSRSRRVATNLNLNRRGAPGSGCQASTLLWLLVCQRTNSVISIISGRMIAWVVCAWRDARRRVARREWAGAEFVGAATSRSRAFRS